MPRTFLLSKALMTLTTCAALLMGTAQADTAQGIKYFNAKNYAAAFREFEAATDQGDPAGQAWLAYLYANGLGVERNPLRAYFWNTQAADQGNSMAQGNLANMYFNGFGVAQDYTQAFKWHQKAAEQGYLPSMHELATLYDRGLGVKADGAQALKWYQKAANAGYAASQFALGFMYSNGLNLNGVAEDATLAAVWYERAAKQGLVMAQSNLALLYEKGKGVKKDLKQALYWYQKAAAQGDKDAKADVQRVTALIAAASPGPTGTNPSPTPTPPVQNRIPQGQKRVALLIGNKDYQESAAKLINPVNDITVLGRTLKSMGFEVTTASNLKRADFVRVLRRFLDSIDGNTVSFFYYSGHGVEIGGQNYLIPVDFNATDEREARDQSVNIKQEYDALGQKAAGSLNFVVLDACRDNPFEQRTRTIGGQGGLNRAVGLRPPVKADVIVAYSAGWGQQAQDGQGTPNSPYAASLNTFLSQPNLTWVDVFGQANDEVRRRTNGQQEPVLLVGAYRKFVFNPK